MQFCGHILTQHSQPLHLSVTKKYCIWLSIPPNENCSRKIGFWLKSKLVDFEAVHKRLFLLRIENKARLCLPA